MINNYNLFRIYETHYTDVYSSKFVDFIKKYKKIIKTNPNLYVNFTNHDAQNIDKTFNENPTHNDPIGMYTYPLQYVLNNPSDVRYASSAKYIRVVEINSNKKLYTSSINNETDLENLMAKIITYRDAKEIIYKLNMMYKKDIEFKFNRYAKYFFKFIQRDVLNESDGNKIYRSTQQQSDLLKKVCDVFIDNSRNEKHAVVNTSEPEQAIFLTRNSFRVVDFLANNLKQVVGSDLYNLDEKLLLRKLAAKIAEAINDKLVGGSYQDKIFFTKNGSRIEIEKFKPQSYYTSRSIFQQKLHKEFKTSDIDEYRIKIYGVFGYYGSSFGNTMTFDEISSQIGEDFEYKHYKTDEIYDFQTLEGYEKELKEERDRITEERRKEEDEKKLIHAKNLFNDDFKKLFNRYGSGDVMDLFKDDSDYFYLDKVFYGCINLIKKYNVEEVGKWINERLVDDVDSDDKFLFGYDEILPENKKQILKVLYDFYIEFKDYFDSKKDLHTFDIYDKIKSL